jgi:CubicO group peptidase (beta-lactamase class C family)
MWRLLLRGLTALSAVLCVLLIVLWVRTLYIAELVAWNTGRDGVSYQFDAKEGGLFFAKSRWRSVAGKPAGWKRTMVGSTQNGFGDVQVPEDFGYHVWFGVFTAERGGGGWNQRFWAVRLPFWFLVLLTAAPPALSAWLRHRRFEREDALPDGPEPALEDGEGG